ncbi:MAG: DUF455 family protein [Acidobacteriota bacterium]|nr:DUF455 family protein [Acidobacteriota bacterium]
MNLEEFAKQVLLSDRLEDKLFVPESFEDENKGHWLRAQTGSIRAPEQPGRPRELAFGSKKKGAEAFPREKDLHLDSERGKVLHFFANHELMALELMALALLKMVDSPPGFRMDIARTMLDEQRHMRLYMQRMHQLGVDFGSVPVSDYFWRNFRTMQTPMDYVCGLSLTLEQANLDFAHHYLNLFQKVDDPRSRDVMEQVYEDEIQHVKQGVKWFNRRRDPELSQWEAYTGGLHLPMTPSRGKGLGFNREGRLRAGLEPAFIDEMEILTEHRGRPRRVWVYNPMCEIEVGRGREDKTLPKPRREAVADLANLPMFLSNRADILYTTRPPGKSFLKDWKQRGLSLPEIVTTGDGKLDGKEFADRIVGGLRPWGWTPGMSALQKRISPQQTELEEGWPDLSWSYPQFAGLYAKHRILELRRRLRERFEMFPFGPEMVDGGLVTSIQEIDLWRERIGCELQLNTVLKDPFGTAGMGQLRLAPDRTLTAAEQGWIDKVLANHGQMLVEPWVLDVDDYSALLTVHRDGTSKCVVSTSRFFTDLRGQYMGTVLGGMTAGMDPDRRRDLEYETNGLSIRKLIPLAGKEAARLLAEQGYYGPAGLDMYTYRLPGAGKKRFLKPAGEINYRFTMGHVARRLEQFLAKGAHGIWMLLGSRHLSQRGIADFTAFGADLAQRFPPCFASDKGLVSGVLFTNEPDKARQMLGVTAVGPEAVNELIRDTGLNL